MAEATSGPNLEIGIRMADLRDGTMLLGRVGDQDVLVARRGGIRG